MHDDETPLARAPEGGEEALLALLEEHGPIVRAGLSGKIGQPWQSVISEDDVMQVTYLEAFLHFKQEKPQTVADFRRWLSRMADNNLRDAIRGLDAAKRPDPRRRVAPANPQDSTVALYEMLGGNTDTPSKAVARQDAESAMSPALAQLPEAYQQVVRLYDLDGLPIEQVAETLRRSPGAVYMLRARALDRLRTIFGTMPLL